MSFLEVLDLSVRFGMIPTMANVSLSLAKRERFGIISESGSGKTLTALAITGLLSEGAKMGGSIALDGCPCPRRNVKRPGCAASGSAWCFRNR
ncbi:MAG: hypothetical protein MO846_07880 [Candidatus Devosia symbiotica]|nr:hypothetical protein [Candidatus Devosia symbiotica]